MSTAQLEAILDEAAEMGALEVRFTGGEPLLREDFAEIYLHARRLGMKVTLLTNGSLVTPDLASLFAKVPPLEPIEITIYGLTPESYEAVTRVPGGHRAVRRAIDLLVDRRVRFLVKGALVPPNAAEMKAFEAWAGTLPGMEAKPASSIYFSLRARRDSSAKNQQIDALRQSPEVGLTQLAGQDESYRRAVRRFCGQFMGPPGDTLFDCGAGQGICVDAYGKIQPCMLLRHPETVYGPSSAAQPLRVALTQFFPRLRQRRAQNPDYLAQCARCFLHGLCEQCAGWSWMEHGTLDTPVEYLCRLAHTKAQYLGLLGAGERGWEVEDWRARIVQFGQRERDGVFAPGNEVPESQRLGAGLLDSP